MSDSDFLTSPSSSPAALLFQCDYADWSPSLSIIPSIYLMAFVVGCLGNGLVLWAYLDRAEGRRSTEKNAGRLCCQQQGSVVPASSVLQKKKKEKCGRRCRFSSNASFIPRPSRSLTDSLIASLALADLCFLVTLPLWAAYTGLGYHWPFGQVLCQLSSFLTALNMYASVFSLSMLSVERYWVLTGRRHSGTPPAQWGCPSRTMWVLGGTWVLAGVLALPGLLLRSVQEVEEDFLVEESDSVAYLCQMDYSMLTGSDLDEEEREAAEMWWAAALSLKSTLVGFLLPLVVLLVCYCSLARLLSRHFGQGPRPDRRRQRRLLRVIVTLVMAFFLCWLPLHVNKTLSMLLELGLLPYSCTVDQILLAAQPYVTCVAYLNSCLNPLLYAACDPSFRKKCKWTLQLLLSRTACRKDGKGKEVKREAPKEEGSSGLPMRTREETADPTQDADMITEG
uniref:apelin receptor 2 n=1 Tax=Doryrhamphus excisus TaxID=161450 RepID=UPI0025AE46B8|nr:apelin receptor 2 [Doryrhamphus excisus]